MTNKDYFFPNPAIDTPWVRGRGWGDNGEPLYLPRDTHRIKTSLISNEAYFLYRSIEQKRWYIINYSDTQSQWYGYTLYIGTETGGYKIACTKLQAMEVFEDILRKKLKNIKEFESITREEYS